MRYVFLATLAVAVSAPSLVYGQSGTSQGLSIVNYRYVTEQRVTLTSSNVTYTADVANVGVALASLTAKLTSLTSSVQVVKDQDTLRFGAVPSNAQISASNTFTILVDRTVPFDWKNIQWTFQPVRLAPVANAGPNQAATVGTTVLLDGSGSTNPSGLGTLTYSWAFATRPSGSTATLSNPTSVMPSFVPDVAGDYLITLTVSNGSASDSASVRVSTVNPPPPVANAGANQSVLLNATVVLDGSKSTSGSGKPLTYSWTLVSWPSGSNAQLAGAATVSPTFVVDKVGNYVAQLVVNDGIANSAPSQVTITTQLVKPVANAGLSQSVNLNSLVTLDGSKSTDANGLPLTYQWSLIALPASSAAVINNPTSVKPTFTADRSGDYVAQLIVSNGTLSSDPVTVTITSLSPLAPTAVAGPNQTVNVGSTVQLSGSGTDPQNLPLTYKWLIVSKPSNSVATLSSTVIANPTFVADLAGTYVVQLQVNNGFIESSPSTVTISTTCAPPTANPGPSQSVVIGSTVTLNGGASGDVCHDPLTYAWSLISQPSGSTATLSSNTAVSTTFVGDKVGVYVAQLIVNNGFTSSAPATVTITVTLQPVIGAPANTSIGLGQSAAFVLILSQAAPSGGLTVNLASDSANVTILPASVTIPAGATQPVTQPQVTGTAIGSAHITATASGYSTATGLVTVTAPTMAFLGSPLSVSVGTTASLTLSLTGGQAPTGGLVVTLTSSDPSKATVPASVTIPAGSTFVATPVTGVALTGASPITITAAATGLANATASVSVTPSMIGVPAATSLGLGESVAFPIILSQAAPAGGVLISLTSNNTAQVTLSQPNIFIAEGQTQPSVQAKVVGVGIGSTTVTVSATGFPWTSGAVTVTAPTMSFAGAPLSVTLGATGSLSLTLTGGVAPPNGLTVTLSSSDPSKASVPASLTIPAGASLAPVTVTGVALTNVTPVTITATTIAGIADATASVTVTPAVIGVPATTSVGLGQSAPFAIILAQPAPAALTVNLSSSDSQKVTISPATVSIAKGATQPATQPQVTGAAIGSATITASASGYASGTGSVTVTAPTMSFSGTPLSVAVGNTGNLTLNLTGGQAPAGGLTVNLSSSDTARATVPDTVAFPAGASSVSVPVTGVAPTGNPVTITASASGIASATASVTITPPVTISVPATTNVGLGQSASFAVTLSEAAPAGGLTISLASSDGTKVSVTPSVFIAANATQPAVQPQVTGLAPGASVTITASATGATAGSGKVNVTTPTLSFTGSPLAINVGTSGTLTLNLTGGVAPTGGLLITLASSDPSKATVPASVTIPAAGSAATVQVTGVGQGQATITASATGLTNATATVNVGPSLSIGVSSNTTLNLGQSAPFTITLSAPAPSGGVTVNLTSADPTKVSVTPASVTIAENTTQPTTQPQIKGLNFGSSLITASATGFTSGTQTVQVTGNISFSPTTLAISGAQTQNLTLNLSGPAPAGGLTINVSSSSAAATVPSTVSFTANATSVSVPVKGVSAGSAVIRASALPNLAETTATVTVSSDIILAANVVVQPGQTVNFPVSLANPAPSGGVLITLAVNDPSILTLVSTNVYIEQGQTKPGSPPQITGVAVGTATISATAFGFMSASQTVQVAQAVPASVTANLGSGQSAQVNTTFSNPLVVTVRDASNNPVSGITVTFAGPASGAGIVTATAVTNTSGLASATVTANPTAGGPYAVTATAGSASATFQLTNTPPPVGSITAVSGGGQTTAANTAFATPLTVMVKDASNTPMNGVTVTFTGPASGAGIAAPVTAVSNAAGIATATVTANGVVGGPYNVTAASGSANAVFALTNSQPPVAALTVNSGSGQSAIINTAFAIPLSVTAKDASNNPVAGVTVAFSGPASGAGIAAPVTATTNASGVATATVTANGTAGGPYTVTAAAGSVTAAFSLTNNANPPASMTVNSGSGQSAQIKTAFAAPLSVTVKDASNNPLSGISVTFTGPASGAGIAAPVTATTNASGVATATVTANLTVGGPYTVTAAAGSVNAAFQLTNTVGPVTSLTVASGSGQTAVINAAFASPLVVTAKDEGGNLVTGATVTFTGPASGAGIAAPATATTNASGVASATVTANGTSGAYTVTAASGSASATFSLTNTVNPPASVTVNSGSGQSAQIKTAFAAPLSVTVKDASNNPLSGISVTFTGPASGAGIAAPATATTNASGVATATVTANLTAGGPYTVTAAAGSVNAAFQLTNTPGPVASVTAGAGAGQSTKINTAFATPLSVTVKDEGNNPLSGVTVSFAGPASGAGIAAPVTASTDASGVAAATVTANLTAGGPYTVTATAGAFSATFALTNTLGDVSSVTIASGSGQSTDTNTAFAAPVCATVKDAGNNLMSGITVSFAGPASGASFATATAVTNASGLACATLTANATSGGPYTATASVNSVSANFQLTNTAPTVGAVTYTSGSGQSTTITTAFAAPLSVTVTDTKNNPMSGVTVSFAGPASGAGIATATAVTNASGVATATVTANSTAGGPYTVTATAGGFSANFQLTNLNRVPASVTVNAGGSQSTAVNTPFSVPLSVTVKDASNNPVSGVTVTFAGPASGAGIVTATAVTDASGVATATVTANTTSGGPYTATATAGSASANFALTNTPGAAASMTVNSGGGQTTPINTAFAAPVSVTVKDSFNNLVSNANVTFTGPASGAGIAAPGSATTNASGVATATLTANSTAGGPYTVTAASGAASATFQLTNSAGAAASITVNSGGGQTTPINTAFAAPVSVTVKDAGNNPLSGVTVTFTGPASGAGIATATGTTNASGVATATLTANGTAGGPYTVTATAGAASATFQLTNGVGAPASVTVNAGSGQSATVNTAFATPVSVTVKDAGNNLLSGVTVTFTGPASGAGIATATGTTNASGVATATLTANTTAGGPYTVTASAGAASGTLQLTNTAGVAASLTATSGTGQSAIVNNTFANPLVVTAKDSFNNAVSGLTVTFTGPASGASIGTKTAVTNASGQASATVTANGTVGGPYTVTASANSLTATFQLTNAVNPPATLIPVSGSNQSTNIGSPFGSPLIVSVRDASNNTLSGVTVTFTGSGIITTSAVSDATGQASAIVTANATAGGPYAVTATAGSATAFFQGMTNLAVTPGSSITMSPLSIGQNLETTGLFTMSPAPSSDIFVNVTSSDPTKLLVASGATDLGTQQVSVQVKAGVSGGGVWLQSLASSGTVTVTLSAAGYTSGTATITLTPSGILLSGPFGSTTSINTNVGASATTLTLTPSRLDSSNNLADQQRIRGGISVSVNISNSTPSVGSVTWVDSSNVTQPLPVILAGGSSSGSALFTPLATGSTTLIATPPAGFSTPTSGATVAATVSSAVINCGAVSVGTNLQTSVSCSMVGGTPAVGRSVVITSDDPSRVLLAPIASNGICTAVGASSITLTTVGVGISQTPTLPDFCVYGQSVTGAATVTVNGSSMGYASSKGNVTVATSGFVIHTGLSDIGASSFYTLFTGNNPVTVYVQPARLNAAPPVVQALAGGLSSASVTVTSATPSVGSITMSPVVITAGTDTATTQFQPLASGSTVISLGTPASPAGFSTPADAYRTVTANVPQQVTQVNAPAFIGQNLQTTGTAYLSPTPVSSTDVTITSLDPSQLLVSASPTVAGAASTIITLPAGSSGTVTYYLQALGGPIPQSLTLHNNTPAAGSISWDAFTLKYQGSTYSIAAGSTSSPLVVWTPGAGTLTGAASVTAPALMIAGNSSGSASSGVSFTVSTPGYPTTTGTTAIVGSGVVFGNTFVFGSAGGATVPVTVSLAALNSDNTYAAAQALRAGAPTLQVTLQSASPSVGTISSPVSFAAGDSSAVAQFTPLTSGFTTLLLTTPSGFVGSSNKTSLTAIVQ